MKAFLFISGFLLFLETCNSFQIGSARRPMTACFSSVHRGAAKGFTKTTIEPSLEETKGNLIDLLPRMTGQDKEYRAVESYVNRLEELYHAPQTLDFLNMAIQGEWQLLFSTNLAGTPNPAKFRLRQLTQKIDCDGLEGKVTNEAVWDLDEQASNSFDTTGTFTVKCKYAINQGSRMILDLEDHVLKPSKGSKIPNDVQGLVGLLHRSMPKNLFDPSEHAIDTTYMDTDIRIVRYTGPRFEGCRDIFIRSSSFSLDPIKPREES